MYENCPKSVENCPNVVLNDPSFSMHFSYALHECNAFEKFIENIRHDLKHSNEDFDSNSFGENVDFQINECKNNEYVSKQSGKRDYILNFVCNIDVLCFIIVAFLIPLYCII